MPTTPCRAGILGMNALMFEDYVKFIANRRLAQVGLTAQFPGTQNPFPVDVGNPGSEKRRRISSRPGLPNTRPEWHSIGIDDQFDANLSARFGVRFLLTATAFCMFCTTCMA